MPSRWLSSFTAQRTSRAVSTSAWPVSTTVPLSVWVDHGEAEHVEEPLRVVVFGGDAEENGCVREHLGDVDGYGSDELAGPGVVKHSGRRPGLSRFGH
jgi:hypothetical protein